MGKTAHQAHQAFKSAFDLGAFDLGYVNCSKDDMDILIKHLFSEGWKDGAVPRIF